MARVRFYFLKKAQKRVLAFAMGCTEYSCRHLKSEHDNEGITCEKCDSAEHCNERYAIGMRPPQVPDIDNGGVGGGSSMGKKTHFRPLRCSVVASHCVYRNLTLPGSPVETKRSLVARVYFTSRVYLSCVMAISPLLYMTRGAIHHTRFGLPAVQLWRCVYSGRCIACVATLVNL